MTGNRNFSMTGSGSLGLESAIAQPENAIEPIENHFVMRDANNRNILINGYPAMQVRHDSGALRIERPGWLVSENSARPVGKRASNRDTLRLAAGQLRRYSLPSVADFEVVQ